MVVRIVDCTPVARFRPSSRSRWSLVSILVVLAALLTASGCRVVSHGQNAEGVRAFQSQQYQQALRSFEQAVATDPNNPDGYYNLASTYHRLAKLNNRPEDWQLAEDTYNRCLDHAPNHVPCHRALAVLLAEQNRTEQAQRLLEGWARTNPTSSDPKIELARLSQELGKPEVARDHLLEAVQASPNDTRALTALGRLHEDLGNKGQALQNYERALAVNNFQPDLQAHVNALRLAMNPRPVPGAIPPGYTPAPTYAAAPGSLPPGYVPPGYISPPGYTAPGGLTPGYAPPAGSTIAVPRTVGAPPGAARY